MLLAEAERRARSNLYRFEENTALLERKESLADMIREQGSRVEQHYEKIGKASAHYEPAVPAWFLALEDAEQAYFNLVTAVNTVKHFVKFLQEHKPALFEVYALKYRDKASLPGKLRRFDQELIFNLIDWHYWPIDRDGGEEFATWRRKKNGGGNIWQ